MLSSAPFIAELPQDLAGRTTSLFTVHGRYGNNALNGDWELGITSNTSAPPQQQSQRTWKSGAPESFTFEITKIPASLTAPAATSGNFTIGGSNVKASYTDIASYEPNAIKIWARSTTTGSGVTIKDLKIKTPGVPGETVFPGTVINVSQGSGTGFQEIIIAGVDFESMSGGTVTLEGNVAMRFGNAPAPRGSSVQFHVIATHIPWVDLDVDSNNDGTIDLTNGRIGKDDKIENDDALPGKRIFLNIDDDNRNGLPDHIDSHSAYIAKVADDDFAEMRLKVAAAALGPLEGFTVRLRYPSDHIRLHATREKLGLVRDLADATDDGSRPYTLPEMGDGFYAWRLGPNVRLPDAVYAEGVTTGRSEVTLELVNPDGDVVQSDAVNLRVENIRLPNAGTQAADWQKENTDTWAGLTLEPGWWIDRSLEKIINAPEKRNEIEIRTRYPEGRLGDVPFAPNVPDDERKAWQGEGTHSKTSSTYANGFALTFDFKFDPGYVQADTNKNGLLDAGANGDVHKLSFFPNSGIKIWGIYEIAIFDSRRVRELPGLAAVPAANQNDASIPLTAPGYTPPESATALMTGLAYGVDPLLFVEPEPGSELRMADLRTDAKGKYDNIATLNANADRLNDDWMTMQIVFTPNQGPVGTYTVEVRLGGEVVYKDPKVTNGTGSSGRATLLSEVADNDKTILFTNHWDSGVRFRNVNVGGAP